MPRILDNINEYLKEALQQSLADSHRIDAAVGYFNLRGWGTLADTVDNMKATTGQPKARLLLGMTSAPQKELRKLLGTNGKGAGMDNSEADDLRKKALDDLRKQLTWGVPSAHDEISLRALNRQMRDGDVQVRLFLRHSLHAKLYLCHRVSQDNPITGYVGSSNLTFAGLASQGELNVDVLDHDATGKLQQWFEDRWEDQFCIDISDSLIELIEESWASETLLDPYLIYLKIAYHLSREAREGLVAYGLPESMKSVLLDFQTAAVQVAARILELRGGVMIGDVVGLGKTLVATALARMLQEEQATETLIVCPKNLVPMWQGYVDEYRLHAKVLSLSLATRDLPDLRRYRLVVVDESHNLRNPDRKDYAALKDYIQANDSKVVLLTATPYNKQFVDVASQLALFIGEDEDLGLRPDHHIKSVGEHQFLTDCDHKPQTLTAFRLSEEPEDWQRLMSLFMVRRTRRFVQDNYAVKDKDDRLYLEFGDEKRFYFPKRHAQPLPHDVSPDDPAAAMTSDETLDEIDSLLLPRYSLDRYLASGVEPTKKEAEIIERWQRAAQGNLKGITRIMLYKRLSSSGHAFTLSLDRHLMRNRLFSHALEMGQSLPVGSFNENAIYDDEGIYEEDALTPPPRSSKLPKQKESALRTRTWCGATPAVSHGYGPSCSPQNWPKTSTRTSKFCAAFWNASALGSKKLTPNLTP